MDDHLRFVLQGAPLLQHDKLSGDSTSNSKISLPGCSCYRVILGLLGVEDDPSVCCAPSSWYAPESGRLQLPESPVRCLPATGGLLLISLELLLDFGKAILNSKLECPREYPHAFPAWVLSDYYAPPPAAERVVVHLHESSVPVPPTAEEIRRGSVEKHSPVPGIQEHQSVPFGHCLNLLDILTELVHLHAKLKDQFLQLESLVIPGLDVRLILIGIVT